jgi:hypothetical protein
MFSRVPAIWILGALSASLIGASPAAALSSKECSEKYQAAKSAGTLGGKSWNDFRKAECGGEAPAAATESAAKTETKTEAKTEAKPEAKTEVKDAAKPATTSSAAVFPSAVASKYAKESAGKARMHTCLDQYHANKTSNGNGGLKWIAKGGGYYSECNKHLKG